MVNGGELNGGLEAQLNGDLVGLATAALLVTTYTASITPVILTAVWSVATTCRRAMTATWAATPQTRKALTTEWAASQAVRKALDAGWSTATACRKALATLVPEDDKRKEWKPAESADEDFAD